jgi:predicted Rossmann fold flavoprotein
MSSGQLKEERNKAGDGPKMTADVIVIGAGASGLMCAAACGKRGRSVVVLDHSEQVGAKILVSGGGRCNFTNHHVAAGHYLSRNPQFCRSALARFTPRDFLSLVEQHHIRYYEKEAGQLFCQASSRAVLTMLLKECDKAGAEILPRHRVTQIEKTDLFGVTTDQGTFTSQSLVIATGGLSYANLGATDLGHRIAKQFGLKIVPPKPGLVPLTLPSEYQRTIRDLAGVSLDTVVSCKGRSYRGNILFTHRGLSGPAVLQASSHWMPGERIVLDLLPDVDIQAAFREKRSSKMEMQNLLAAYFPKRFAQVWCELQVISKPLNQYSEKNLRLIAGMLHAWELAPGGTEGYRVAEVTVGGVDTRELSSKTMETRAVRGLYFIGEVLDVTGELGGYNLHWAWASGHAAGQYA